MGIKGKAAFKMRKLIFGKGINDYDKPIRIDGRIIPSYIAWKDMLRRCYDPKYHALRPNYIYCEVCDEWIYFSKFKAWHTENHIEGYHLDKDILKRGNKMYSASTCSYVPRSINALLNSHKNKRGKYPIGMSYDRQGKCFMVQVNINGNSEYLGRFKTIAEAFSVYKKAKETHIKEVAQDCYDKKLIKENIYRALLNWTIEITD